MSEPKVCPECNDTRVMWEGGGPPYGPDIWTCLGCAHEWQTGPTSTLVLDPAEPGRFITSDDQGVTVIRSVRPYWPGSL